MNPFLTLALTGKQAKCWQNSPGILFFGRLDVERADFAVWLMVTDGPSFGYVSQYPCLHRGTDTEWCGCAHTVSRHYLFNWTWHQKSRCSALKLRFKIGTIDNRTINVMTIQFLRLLKTLRCLYFLLRFQQLPSDSLDRRRSNRFRTGIYNCACGSEQWQILVNYFLTISKEHSGNIPVLVHFEWNPLWLTCQLLWFVHCVLFKGYVTSDFMSFQHQLIQHRWDVNI
jgi:hypothetical protein